MTQIIKEGGKTIIKTGSRIDTMNANQFEQDIQPALREGGVDLEMDCSECTRSWYSAVMGISQASTCTESCSSMEMSDDMLDATTHLSSMPLVRAKSEKRS